MTPAQVTQKVVRAVVYTLIAACMIVGPFLIEGAVETWM